jgi:translocator protein
VDRVRGKGEQTDARSDRVTIGSLAAAHAAKRLPSAVETGVGTPSWLFGPIWAVLYAMIAYAGWRVWTRTGVDRSIGLYATQPVVNAAWTPVFFAAHSYGLAAAVIIGLWILIAATGSPRGRWSALAAGHLRHTLNIAIWIMNN